jgi:hypothetical protein
MIKTMFGLFCFLVLKERKITGMESKARPRNSSFFMVKKF